MKLRMLRAHYTKKANAWVPKQAFNSVEEAEEVLGNDPRLCSIYKCVVCNALHGSKHSIKDSK